jgi:hypothetical protein
MRKFNSNEVGVGFSSNATESEFKAAEKALAAFFGGRVTRCFRDGYWVVAVVKDLSGTERVAFAKMVTSNSRFLCLTSR